MARRKVKAAKPNVVKAVVEESNRERFVRLINPRVNTALKRISLVGNLSASQYEFTAADVDKIEKALLAEVTAAMNRFRKVKDVSRFSI